MNILQKSSSLILICFFIIIISCKKENPRDKAVSTTIYTDFKPDIVLPLPSEYGSLTKKIDINGDSLFDLTAYLYHGSEYYGPHEYNTYYASFNRIDSLMFICKPFTNGPCKTALDSTMYVSDKNEIISSFMILNLMPVTGINCCTLETTKFVGFYLRKNNNKYFGWIRSSLNNGKLTIYDCAINKTPNDSIKAGYK